MVLESSGAPCSCLALDKSSLVNGVRIDPLDGTAFLDSIKQFVACGKSHVVHFIPADPTVLARRDNAYRGILNRGSLNVPDGMSVVWVLRLRRRRTRRIPGTDALMSLCAANQLRSLGHFFIGGTLATVGKLEPALTSRFPGLTLSGMESPPFRDLSDVELVEMAGRVRASNATFLWLGLGTPKQDYVADALARAGAAPVILCVGAAFDFAANAKKRAPHWLRASGFEWLHRLFTEPRRLWRRYLIGNPLFVWGVIRDVWPRATRERL